MLCGESSISHKVPFKDCKNFTINHNLVIIHLSLEWPDKAGDNPNLVLDIIDKKTSTKPDKNETSMSYFQQNQTSSSIHGNTVHYRPENIASTYPQQYYLHYPSAINNTDPSSSTGDHNDVSSTTTTVPFNTIQVQPSPVYLRQPPLNPQYLSSQHVIQTPPSFINDSRPNMQMMPNISSISPTKHPPSIPTHVDLQQQQQPPPPITYPPTSVSANSSLKYLVCSCLKPHIAHDLNCPAAPLTSQQSIVMMPSAMINQPPSDRKVAQQSQARLNGAISLPSMKEAASMITPSLLPFINPNLMNTSNVTATIPPQLQLLHNNQIGLTIKLPRTDHDNSFQQPLNSSPVIINNPPNFQSNSMVKKPTGKQRSIAPANSRPRKNRPIQQNSLPNQDQTSFPNLNNSQQQVYFLNGFNSPEKQQQQQQSTTPPSHLSSPIQLQQQGMFIFNDNTQAVTNVPSGITLINSPNDMNGNNIQQQQQSPRINRMIRSPVKLDISSPPQPTTVSPAQIEQTINDVVKGKGDISVNNTLVSTDPQQPSLSPQLVWETTGRVTTKTYLSPLHQKQRSIYDSNVSTLTHPDVVNLAQRVVTPNTTEQNKMNTASQQQQTTSTNKKRNRSTPTANAGSKRNCNRKSTIPISQSSITPSSQRDISGTTTKLISPTSNSINKPISWPSDVPISVSPRFVTTTTKKLTDTSTGNLTQHSTSFEKNDAWLTSGVDNTGALIDSYPLVSGNEQQIPLHHPYEFIFNDDEFASKPDDQFHSSTPPPLPLLPILTSSQLFPSLLTEKTSLTVSNNIYDNFFHPNMSSSSTTWGENQVTSSVLTPPDPQNNHFPQQQQQQQQQQYSSPIDEHFDSFLQSQTPTSQIIEPTSNRYNQMNNNDIKSSSFSSSDHQPKQQSSQKLTQQQQQSNKSLKHSSKISRQQTRSNPIQKQQTATKPTCTRCGLTQLIDITHHEFPKQKGLVFECVSCGNSSIRSNVSDNERRRRLAMVAADHLNIVECQFCHTRFNSHNDYLMHLRNDHASNKPM